MKIIVTGDIHIGKRSSAIVEHTDYLSTKYTWKRIVTFAIREEADLLILTGDVVDRDNRFFEAVSPLQAGLQKLDEAGIPVFIVAGNHDYDVLPEIIGQTGLPNVFLLGEGGKWTEQLFEKNGERLQLIGWSFASRYYEQDPVAELPAGVVREDMPTLAVVHGDALMLNTSYAPMSVTQMKALRQVDAWLLGHVHKPQVIAEEPLIIYPGSPQALNPKETGVHGPYWLEMEQRKVTVRQIALSPVRYEKFTMDVSAVKEKEVFREKIVTGLRRHTERLSQTEDLKYLVYDIELTGEHNEEKVLWQWSREALDYTGNGTFEEKVRAVEVNVAPCVRVETFLNDPSYMGVLANAIQALEKQEPNTFVDRLREQWTVKQAQMAISSTYSLLPLAGDKNELVRQADAYILKECRRLFTELYNQRKDAD